MSRKSEHVIYILAEGGGLSISRITIDEQHRFLTSHQEYDFSDEGLDVNKEIGYSSFEEAFQYIDKYPWHMLHLEIVHKDYRGFILNRLIDRLGKEAYKPNDYLNRKLRHIEDLLFASIFKTQSGQWYYSDTDPSAATQWKKSNISFENYQNYIKTKQNRFELTLIDLLYISNFKGGNATINEPEYEINYKLGAYTNKLWMIEKEFYNKSLAELNSQELERLADLVSEICDLTNNNQETSIDGFRISYLSALLSAHFPNLIPILDRRVLKGLKLVTEQDENTQGQIKNIQRFYRSLMEKVASMSKYMGLSVREIDRKLFVTRINR